MKALLLSTMAVLALAAPAVAEPIAAKQIPSTKAQAVYEITHDPNVGRGSDIPPNTVSHIKCKGYKLRHGKARHWTCTFHYTTPPSDIQQSCVARFRLAKVGPGMSTQDWYARKLSLLCKQV